MILRFNTLLILIYSSVLLLSSCRVQTRMDDSALTAGLVKDIAVLASDSLSGRAPCSIGENRTIAYLEKRMRETGLEPAFDGKYLQDVALVKIRTTMPGNFNFQTPKGMLTLAGGSDVSAWSPVTTETIQLDKSQLVFAGFGINAPEQQWNDFAGIDVKGKVLVVIVNDPGFFTGDTTLFRGKTMTYYGRWTYKLEEAERHGAAACLIIHEEEAAGYPWAVVNRHHNNTEFYLSGPRLTDSKCRLQGWLSRNAAEKLFAACGRSLDEMIMKATKRGFKPEPLPITLTMEAHNASEQCVSHNVGGILKGTQKPDEVVVYSAHWDHLGTGIPVNGDSIYNGASDNAAGVAWMLDIAGKFVEKGQPHIRSVLFLSPTCEEHGLLGSEWYVQHPAFPLKKTVACLNSDVYLFLGHFKDVTVTGPGYSDLDEVLKTEAQKLGRYIAADPNPENGMLFRSDQLPMMKAGIPSLFAKGYIEQSELGKSKTKEKIKAYWQNIYHKPCDEYNPTRDNLSGLADDADLFYRVGKQLADSSYFPKWKKGSEFYIER